MTRLKRGTPEEAGFDPARIALIHERAGQWITQGRTPQLALVVARKGVIALAEGYGPSRPGNDAPPVTPDSVFPISSNTKPITATALMTLVEDGLVGLSRPVAEYIPEMTGYGRENILVQHLLTHTSGYDSDTLGQCYALFQRIECPPKEDTQHERVHRFLTAFLALRPTRPPGELMTYSNENYMLLGEIVRRVSGQSLEDFAQQRIFVPLGMTNTSYRLLEHIEDRLVHPVGDFLGKNDDDWDGPSMIDRGFLDGPNPGGGVLTSALDYAAFLQSFLNGGTYGDVRLLGPRAVEVMTTNQIPGVGTIFFGNIHPEASWGYGFRVQHDERWRWFDGAFQPKGAFSHGGAGGTIFWADPVNDVVGVFFSTCVDIDREQGDTKMDYDLFQNMVATAIVD